ncbi:MAG: bifunctional riboflavin kinase/FAD synthetase [Proteobacteria bacterium]|nr:bifunctional riboflavin kinase/FAD synthetase [Pseudomonadota bacterium]
MALDVKLIRDGRANPCVATIGTFDSLHVGHQEIIKRVVSQANALCLIPSVITFEPLPQTVLQTNHARMLGLSQKLTLLFEMGIRQVICLRFNSPFAQISPSEFVKHYLVDKLNVRLLVIGEGFRFGHQQQGTVQTLLKYAAQFGFAVEPMKHVQTINAKVSSTLIRQALMAGDLKQASHLLGRHFSICARVTHGAKRGREIGFPTANLAKNPAIFLLNGVFVTQVIVENKKYQSVANCGTRPTVKGKQQLLEVHLLGYEGDLYGKRIAVEFLHKLRDERHFIDITQLKQQITQDIQATLSYFKGSP